MRANALAIGISIQDVPEDFVVAAALLAVGYSRGFSVLLGIASCLVEPGVQRGAEGARLIDDLAGPGDAMAWQGERQARTPPNLLGCSHPVLPEHQAPVRPAPAVGAGIAPRLLQLAKLDRPLPDFITVCRLQKTSA